MPPRKRKQQTAGGEQPAEEASQLPDRDDTARKIQEKLEALDRAGELEQAGCGWALGSASVGAV